MTISKLRQRLAALESTRGAVENIVLLMSDGSTELLPGRDAVRLLGRALRNDGTPEMELIARSVASTEPDDAHMIDLARALLNSPTAAEPGTRG
jgi:hypothetical protein